MPESQNQLQRYVPRKSFDQRLLLFLRPLRRLAGLTRANWQRPCGLSLADRCRAWRWGLLYRSYNIYDLEQFHPRLFLRDHADIDYFLLDPTRRAAADKLTFLRLMQAAELPTPRGLGFIRDGMVLPLDSDGPIRQPLEWLQCEDEARAGFLLRPIDGFGGHGVQLVPAWGGEPELGDGERERYLTELAQQIARLDSYLITRLVDQHEYARALHPGTPNTLRILTLWDMEKARPFIAAAVQRIGRPGGHLDGFNAGLGGLSVEVDLATGVLGLAVGVDEGGRRATWPRHPETGAPISGVTVASWPRVCEVVVRAAMRLPHSPYLGWDLLVDRHGEVRLLEANPAPGTIVWQVHRPLLADPRARRFFESLGMA